MAVHKLCAVLKQIEDEREDELADIDVIDDELTDSTQQEEPDVWVFDSGICG